MSGWTVTRKGYDLRVKLKSLNDSCHFCKIQSQKSDLRSAKLNDSRALILESETQDYKILLKSICRARFQPQWSCLEARNLSSVLKWPFCTVNTDGGTWKRKYMTFPKTFFFSFNPSTPVTKHDKYLPFQLFAGLVLIRRKVIFQIVRVN